MFIGREYELAELERLYQSGKFEMPVVYGRRRVGKSTLLREFIKGKRAVYFTAIESTLEKNLEILSSCIYRTFLKGMPGLPPFQTLEAALEFLHGQALQERMVFIIDEYPYLAESDQSVSSRLQSYIDEYFQNSSMYLILCGSSMSFMEQQVLGYQSPLYGRRTAQFRISAFDYRTAVQFVPEYTPEDQALVYGVTGGIPKYLELFETGVSVRENIIHLFFQEEGYLYEEPSNLMKQELKDPATYNAIMESLANGATKVSEIASKLHMDTAAVSYGLGVLISLDIVSKETAVTEENNKKKTYYSLKDSMFRFWFRFVPNGTGRIALKEGRSYFEELVEPQLSDYMGSVFEDMCRYYLMWMNKENHLPYKVLKIGRWWGTNKKERQEEGIDILAVNSAQKQAVFGECKYRKEKTDVAVAEALVKKAELFGQFEKKAYILFSKNGFTEAAKTYGAEHSMQLIDLKEMYE